MADKWRAFTTPPDGRPLLFPDKHKGGKMDFKDD